MVLQLLSQVTASNSNKAPELQGPETIETNKFQQLIKISED